jgi:glycosyltransferase involved in cell wall biosynthesis
MRVLAINYEYPPIGGGGGFVTRDIFEQVVQQGHGVTVITSYFKGLKKYEKQNGVEIIRVPVIFRNQMEVANIPSLFSYFPSSFLRGIHHCKGYSYDVINTHFTIPSGPTGYLLSRILGLPNVLSIHGGDIFDPSKALSPHKTPLLRNVVQFVMTKADVIVAQSSDTQENACKYYDINRHIKIIPLGIKKPFFEKKCREDFNLDHDEIVFCTIGRLIKRKNISDTLEILSTLKDRYKFKFIVIGDGPERAHLKRHANSFGLEQRVNFLGNVSDEVKFQVLDLSDCYVSTALHEGFGLVFLGYNCGGQNDFLVSGKSGLLVQLGNKDEFGDRLLEVISNSELRASMAIYNRNLVKDFSIEMCAEKYINLFQSVLRVRSSLS